MSISSPHIFFSHFIWGFLQEKQIHISRITHFRVPHTSPQKCFLKQLHLEPVKLSGTYRLSPLSVLYFLFSLFSIKQLNSDARSIRCYMYYLIQPEPFGLSVQEQNALSLRVSLMFYNTAGSVPFLELSFIISADKKMKNIRVLALVLGPNHSQRFHFQLAPKMSWFFALYLCLQSRYLRRYLCQASLQRV